MLKAAEMLRVTCLPVGHGDCILAEYGDARAPARILIDGGPAHTYGAVREAVQHIPKEQRHFELIVVTHVDADHIDGALILLQDEALALTVDDVWFNGWEQLRSPEAPDTFNPVQGSFLEALLDDRPWNVSFGGKRIVAADEGVLSPVKLPGGAELTLVSPRDKDLKRLRTTWKKVLRDAGLKPDEPAGAAQRLLERRTYAPPVPREDVFAVREFGSDAAIANGSSIAFVLQAGGHRVLFAADAHAPVLAEGLARMAQTEGVERLRLDAVKLPHHGSMANISTALLDVIECSHFLVSTNGDYFDHPDPETIKLLGEHAASPTVQFNHRSPSTEPWTDPDRQRLDGIRAVFPPEGLVFTATDKRHR